MHAVPQGCNYPRLEKDCSLPLTINRLPVLPSERRWILLVLLAFSTTFPRRVHFFSSRFTEIFRSPWALFNEGIMERRILEDDFDFHPTQCFQRCKLKLHVCTILFFRKGKNLWMIFRKNDSIPCTTLAYSKRWRCCVKARSIFELAGYCCVQQPRINLRSFHPGRDGNCSLRNFNPLPARINSRTLGGETSHQPWNLRFSRFSHLNGQRTRIVAQPRFRGPIRSFVANFFLPSFLPFGNDSSPASFFWGITIG